jgi:16S rRNA pseudouridine516 synthase
MSRLDHLLARLGYGSRREVAAWIRAGRVTVAGQTPRDAGLKVRPSDVQFDGEPLDHPDDLLLLLNKPVGLVCSHDPREGPNVYGLLPERWRRRHPPLVSVGRLDKETSGLLLLTDRSALVHRLTSPKHKVPKVYRAVLAREAPPTTEALFASGEWTLPGETEPCAPAALRRVGPRVVELTLTEGRYHQVRRMLAAQGCEVLELERVGLGGHTIDNLPVGSWKELDINSFS